MLTKMVEPTEVVEGRCLGNSEEIRASGSYSPGVSEKEFPLTADSAGVEREALAEIRGLKAPFEADELPLSDEFPEFSGFGIVGASRAVKSMMSEAQQVAGTDSTVLILGETGTGKELLARHIHLSSLRRDKPFVVVNMGAMPDTLIESELFGRERGAFTGAMARQAGRFEIAHRGTIFLDEIGEMSLGSQVRLLRVLQGGDMERLGSSETVKVDVRVIAATNRDLKQLVRDGKFREDLYYRLNVFPIAAPPLRQRTDDIPPLVWSFVREFGKRMGKPIQRIQQAAMARLQAYPWPGNIRELRNVIERSMILTKGPELHLALPESLPGLSDGLQPADSLLLEEVENRHIQRVLEMARGRIRGAGGAAELLGMKPTTLYSKMKKLGIRRPGPRIPAIPADRRAAR